MQSFTFHSVGQGLFHSGRIGDFQYVYDCGTSSGTRYVEKALLMHPRPNRPLDLLVLSHFHADHMNGVKRLLQIHNGAKEIVLPYLLPEERLMAGAGYAHATRAKALDHDYISFVSNPVDFLRENAAEGQISMLDPAKHDPERPNQADHPDAPSGWEPNHTCPVLVPSEDGTEITLPNATRRTREAVYRGNFWQFRFYCQPSRVSATAITEALDLSSSLDATEIRQLLEHDLERLKGVYLQLFGGSAGQNSTSVLCCHGPRIGHETYAARPAEGETHLSTYPFQLLTGDATLDTKAIGEHFRNERDRVGLMLVPHHGSSRSWNDEIFDTFPNCSSWVLSAGLHNRYRHPCKKLLASIAKRNHRLYMANEIQWLSYEKGWETKSVTS